MFPLDSFPHMPYHSTCSARASPNPDLEHKNEGFMKDTTAIFIFSACSASATAAFVGKYGPPPLKRTGFVLSDCSGRIHVPCSGTHIRLFPLLIHLRYRNRVSVLDRYTVRVPVQSTVRVLDRYTVCVLDRYTASVLVQYRVRVPVQTPYGFRYRNTDMGTGGF
jgi:hypothetical protein